jgi:HEAT repeat protein
MIPGISGVVKLLSYDNPSVRSTAAKLFGKLVNQREFLYISPPTEL